MARLALIALLGCAPARTARLQEDVDRLEAEVEAKRAEVGRLRTALEKAERPWRRDPPTHIPKGFDPSRPLPAPGPTPDILLVSIDTLRADHLGTYGYTRPTSPFVDSLAERGTRYDAFWSPSSWTLPSHTTMLSGLLPDRHGAIEGEVRIGPGVPMLQETLKSAGYRTAGVVATLFVSRRFGFERGFDHFEDFGITDPAANNRGVVDAEEVFAQALHWAQQQPDGTPLFAFLHVYDVHYTYNPPAPFDERFDRPAKLGDAVYKNYFHYKKRPLDPVQMEHQIAQYDEEIAYVDAKLAELVTAWEAGGRPVIVAVTADHGEEFGERGSWGHAHTLYPEQLHVPFVVAGPGVKHQVVAERAGTEDIAATLAALAGASHPRGDGIDRSAQVARGGALRPTAPYAETSRFDTLVLRVHDGGYDLVADLRASRFELCDLRVDPGCTTDLSTTHTAELARMKARLSERIGTPWSAREEGDLRTGDGGVIWAGELRGTTHRVGPGDGFAVLPPDGSVRFRGQAGTAGPYQALAGKVPESGSPLAYSGPTWGSVDVELSDEEQQMLRDLGYIQD
ncbi:MAG: sulfatase [Alphaproteobacteria bacterium]|nr:sulfatase [Alphaproteobacteria bacterium]